MIGDMVEKMETQLNMRQHLGQVVTLEELGKIGFQAGEKAVGTKTHKKPKKCGPHKGKSSKAHQEKVATEMAIALLRNQQTVEDGWEHFAQYYHKHLPKAEILAEKPTETDRASKRSELMKIAKALKTERLVNETNRWREQKSKETQKGCLRSGFGPFMKAEKDGSIHNIERENGEIVCDSDQVQKNCESTLDRHIHNETRVETGKHTSNRQRCG